MNMTRLQDVREWCRGRFWPGRLLLLAFFAYLGIRYAVNPQHHSLFDGINLGIHEAGHLLFRFLGSEFLYMAGGTILQLAAPVAAVVVFLRQPDYFGVCVSSSWLATNLYGVATYVGDARALGLPLVTVGGGEAIHDWHYLLGRLDMLSLDTAIAAFLRVAAFAAMWGGIAAGLWLVYLMATDTAPEFEEERAAAAPRAECPSRSTGFEDPDFEAFRAQRRQRTPTA